MSVATAVNPREKENISAPALAFVFAWHRISAIGAYGQECDLSHNVPCK
jgi:hypothetical protein